MTDCHAQGRGFESRQSQTFKVSRLNKRRIRSFCVKAHKSLNLPNLTKNILQNFITQSYLQINRNSKLINFFVNYPNKEHFQQHDQNSSNTVETKITKQNRERAVEVQNRSSTFYCNATKN